MKCPWYMVPARSGAEGPHHTFVGGRQLTSPPMCCAQTAHMSSAWHVGASMCATLSVLITTFVCAAGLKPSDIQWTSGTIGLSMAHACHHVYGFEYAPSSVADARQNAASNGIGNATFVQADLDSASGVLSKHCPKPDVVITGDLGLLSLL